MKQNRYIKYGASRRFPSYGLGSASMAPCYAPMSCITMGGQRNAGELLPCTWEPPDTRPISGTSYVSELLIDCSVRELYTPGEAVHSPPDTGIYSSFNRPITEWMMNDVFINVWSAVDSAVGTEWQWKCEDVFFVAGKRKYAVCLRVKRICLHVL